MKHYICLLLHTGDEITVSKFSFFNVVRRNGFVSGKIAYIRNRFRIIIKNQLKCLVCMNLVEIKNAESKKYRK